MTITINSNDSVNITKVHVHNIMIHFFTHIHIDKTQKEDSNKLKRATLGICGKNTPLPFPLSLASSRCLSLSFFFSLSLFLSLQTRTEKRKRQINSRETRFEGLHRAAKR